jgi:hypothetical protein
MEKNRKNMRFANFVKILVPAWFEQGTWPSNLEIQRLDQLSQVYQLFETGSEWIKHASPSHCHELAPSIVFSDLNF